MGVGGREPGTGVAALGGVAAGNSVGDNSSSGVAVSVVAAVAASVMVIVKARVDVGEGGEATSVMLGGASVTVEGGGVCVVGVGALIVGVGAPGVGKIKVSQLHKKRATATVVRMTRGERFIRRMIPRTAAVEMRRAVGDKKAVRIDRLKVGMIGLEPMTFRM